MPLLGRPKTPAGLAGANQAAASKTAARQPLVCESPLFGVRRQLPVASASAAANGPGESSAGTTGANCSASAGPGGLHSSMSLTQNLSGRLAGRAVREARAEAAAASERLQQLEQTLSSIPAQITRQQIHYAFSIIDTNSDGLINLRDLSQMLANLGVPIDEAILSHVLAPVARRRGDHLISESEFLHWIGNFIQVSDQEDSASLGASSTSSRRPAPTQAKGNLARSRRGQNQTRTQVARSASAATSSSSPQAAGLASSLDAQSPEAQYVINQQVLQRRGSGSGLALMRSLSSTGQSTSSSTANTSRRKGSFENDETDNLRSSGQLEPTASSRLLLEQQETRNDLKAAFCVFDLDGDGFITLDEVQQGLKLLGESWTQEELDQLFSKCGNQTLGKPAKKTDLNKRRISIDDFVQLLL